MNLPPSNLMCCFESSLLPFLLPFKNRSKFLWYQFFLSIFWPLGPHYLDLGYDKTNLLFLHFFDLRFNVYCNLAVLDSPSFFCTLRNIFSNWPSTKSPKVDSCVYKLSGKNILPDGFLKQRNTTFRAFVLWLFA